MWWYSFLVFATLQLVIAQQQRYTLSLSDQSPAITYSPASFGNGTNSWNVSYSGSPWSSFSSEDLNTGKGQSIHWTNTSQATISFSFVGTGFTAHGKLSGSATVILTLDGSTIGFTTTNAPMMITPTLSSASNLTYGNHQVSLTMKGDGGIEFYGVDLILAIGRNGDTYTNSTQIAAIDNTTLNTAFQWSTDDWAPTITSSGNMEAFTGHQNASLQFNPPSNTSLFLLYGSTDPNTFQFTVSLSSSAYSGNTNSTTPQSQTFLPVTPWATDGQIYYFAILIPGYQYTVKVQAVGQSARGADHSDLSILRAVSISASSDGPSNITTPGNSTDPNSGSGNTSSSSSSSNKGVIAGAVVGGVVGLLALGILAYFCLARRRKSSRKTDEVGTKETAGEKPFDVDGGYQEEMDNTGPRPVPFRPSSFVIDGGTSNSSGTVVNSNPDISPTHSTPSKSVLPATRPSISTVPPISIQSVQVGSQMDQSLGAGGTGTGTGTGSSPSSQHQESSTLTSTTGLDPSDPTYHHKWAVLHELDPSPTSTNVNRSSVENGGVGTERREVDAGRLESSEEMLPPDYNPAWLANRRGQGGQ